MRLFATLCILAMSPFATAAPFVVSDPVAVGVTQCGVYVDTAPRVTSAVVAAVGGNMCEYDLADVAAGAHLVAMTAITVNDPLLGSQESAKSSPLAFTIPGTPALNFQGLWWNSPAGSESGRGINFATPLWLGVTAPQTSPGTYAGTLYRTTGPVFNAVPFNPASVLGTTVGPSHVQVFRRQYRHILIYCQHGKWFRHTIQADYAGAIRVAKNRVPIASQLDRAAHRATGGRIAPELLCLCMTNSRQSRPSGAFRVVWYAWCTTTSYRLATTATATGRSSWNK